MNLVKVQYDKSADACHELLIKSNLTPEQALGELNKAKYPAYIYEPAHINTDAYFLTEVKNKACIKEYAKTSD